MRTFNLGFYRLTYPGGIVQVKELVGTADFQYYQSLHKEKHELEILMRSSKNKAKDPALLAQMATLNKTIKEEFPVEFFIEGSPLHKAIETGFIYIDPGFGNSGDYSVKMEKIEEADALPKKEIE
jgi:hypothetical protein